MRHLTLPTVRLARSFAATLAVTCALALPASAQMCGDVNDNGSVTTGDALSVLRYAVGQEVNLICDGECAVLDPRVTALEEALADAQAQLAQVQALLEGVSRTDEALVISGTNLQVVDGSGSTTGPVNGFGNIIVGYNEGTQGQERTGSHNLVLGIENDFTSFGGVVAGEGNAISARAASVLGGSGNLANGPYASVGGGFLNEASGTNAVVSGGCENMATNTYSAVSGGRFALASGQWSSVTGGNTNKATAAYSSVSGGSTLTTNVQFGWRAGSLVQP